jgi:hypothetical protein
MFVTGYNIGDAVFELADRRPELYKNPIMKRIRGSDE